MSTSPVRVEDQPSPSESAPELTKFTYTIAETAEIFSIGYTTLWRLLKSGRSSLVVIQFGSKKLVTRTSIEAVLDGSVPLERPAA